MEIITYSIPVFLALILLEVVFDAVKNRDGNRIYRLNDAITNISCGVIDQITGLFAKVFTFGAYVLVFNWAQEIFANAWASNWFWYTVAFVAVDFAYYWSHRWSHQVNLFWVGHVVHHQSEEYNLSVALRQGAFQKMLMFWVYLPLAVLGLPPIWFLSIKAINLLYQFWIHTEVIGKMGILEEVFNTPSHHRVHHGRNPKYIDRNHAGIFIVWDRMFGTFQREEEHPTYGITNPTGTFNAVGAHIQPFVRLTRAVSKMPSFGDKVRYLFKPPGWLPEKLGGFQSALPIEQQPANFNIEIPIQLSWYAAVQYISILGVGALYLFTVSDYDLAQQIGYGAWLLLGMFSLGALLDSKKWGYILELFRLVLLPLGLYWIFPNLGFLLWSIVLAMILLSAFWLIKISLRNAHG